MPWLLSRSQAAVKANLGAQSPVSTLTSARLPQGRQHGKQGEVPALALQAGHCTRCRRPWAPRRSASSAGGQSRMEQTSQGAAQRERALRPSSIWEGEARPLPRGWQSRQVK